MLFKFDRDFYRQRECLDRSVHGGGGKDREGILQITLSRAWPRGRFRAQSKTLGKTKVSSCGKPPETIKDLAHPISSYATLNDRDVYVIAYYWNLPSGMPEDPLRVLSFDKQTGEWKSAQLMLAGDQIAHGEWVGSVLHVCALADTFLLDTHSHPSAGCLLILSRSGVRSKEKLSICVDIHANNLR